MRNKSTTRKPASKGNRYKVTNWNEYNSSLKNRGSITLWIGDDAEKEWYHQGEKKKGGQFTYSDMCIEVCCVIRKVYRLPFRQTAGFMESLVKLSALEVKIPDYSLICRRSKVLKISIPVKKRGMNSENLHIVMDSTGLKVYGEGEWKVRQHGYGKHRTWRKIHIAIEPATGMIQAAEMTTNGVDDASMVKPVLEKIKGKIKTFSGDGAYDKLKKVYDVLEKKGIKPVIPPQKNARITKHGNCKGRTKPRDRAIRYIRAHGRAKWKKDHKYHKRSMAENTMYRYKTILGDRLQSRTFERQCVEALLCCKILNKMNLCGMPISVKVK